MKALRNYGYVVDSLDARDHHFVAAPHIAAAELPMVVDTRTLCGPIHDQGDLGSCTGNAIAGMIEYERNKERKPSFNASRLFIYYNERAMEGSIKLDNGAQIRDGIKSVAKLGVCRETTWPYDIQKFANKPKPAAFAEALKYKALAYNRVLSHEQILQALAGGSQVVFGFSVYDSFESANVAKTGIMPMPNLQKERLLGGHSVRIVGYDQRSGMWIVANSWGLKWGMAGYFFMPFAITQDPNMSDDFWTITMESA